jgi:hypothetical protein
MAANIKETVRKLINTDNQIRKEGIIEHKTGNEEMLSAILIECKKRGNFDDPFWKRALFTFFSKSMAYNLAEKDRIRNDHSWRFRHSAMIIFRHYPNFVESNRRQIMKFRNDLNGKVRQAVEKCLEIKGLSDDKIELSD